MSSNNGDDFVSGVIAVAILGLAAYGTYKIIQNITKSSDERFLENLGRDLEAIDRGYMQDIRRIPYEEVDDGNS